MEKDVFKPYKDWVEARRLPVSGKFTFTAMFWREDGSAEHKTWIEDNAIDPNETVDRFVKEIYKDGYVQIPGDFMFDNEGKTVYGNRFVFPVSEFVKIGVVYKKVVNG
jgi:hypothetical protein